MHHHNGLCGPGVQAQGFTYTSVLSFCRPHLSYPFTSSKPPPLLLVMPAVHLDISYALAQGEPHSTPLTDSRAHGMGQTAQSGSSLPGLAFSEQAPAGLMSPGRNHRLPTKPMATFFSHCLCLPKEDDFLCHPALSL